MLDLTARPRSTASSSTASICSCSTRTSASIRATTTSSALADKIAAKGLAVGSLVAPVWPPAGGGSAMGGDEERKRVRHAGRRRPAASAQKLRELGVRPYGVVRIDSAAGVADWAKDPAGNTKRIAETFREACEVAEDHGERLAAEGEICWGGMHSWKHMVQLLEDGRPPKTLGFQADMAHTLLLHAGLQRAGGPHPARELRLGDRGKFHAALKKLTDGAAAVDHRFPRRAERRHREGLAARTTRPAATAWPTDPNGKLDIVRDAGYWLRDDDGKPTKAFQHICWDGCMFPNEVMMKPADLERHPRAP